MDRDVPPKVTYWTGIWDPSREAISKEVDGLRRSLAPGSPVVSFSLGQRSGLNRPERVLTLSCRRWLTLRAIAALVEPRGDVTHAFGSLDGWHLLRSLGRRPLLYTVAIPGPALDRELYDHVTTFAVESRALAQPLLALGVPADRIEVVYPGIDLSAFRPASSPPPSPFRLLFASTPADVRYFESRGIPLMIELARRRRDIHLTLLWRRWGNVGAAQRALRELAPGDNVELRVADVEDMAAVYRSAHATMCCFAPGTGKSIPNSVIEGLACGRPALVTEGSGISEVVDQQLAGVVADRSVEALCDAVDTLRANYPFYARNARTAAEQLFDLEATRRAYARLYDELAPQPGSLSGRGAAVTTG
jgi:glycosyltransferase involved in cell wall biosynthesis